jgi:hypothetical protein
MVIADSARCSATLLVFLTLSCSDSLEPGTLGQSYRLDQVAGDALPTVLYTNEVGTFHIISQFIHFGPKGTGSLSETAQMVPHAGEPQEPQESTSGIQWAEVDGRIEIEFDCPANTNCLAGPHLVARIDGHSLRATWGRQISGRSPLYYVEVVSHQ